MVPCAILLRNLEVVVPGRKSGQMSITFTIRSDMICGTPVCVVSHYTEGGIRAEKPAAYTEV